jgi:hypothetical protein
VGNVSAVPAVLDKGHERQLIDLMRKRQSPLMILVYWNNVLHMTHFRVVKRIYSDDGQDLVDFNDPGTGKEETGFVLGLIEGMEAAADKFPTAQVFYW